MSPSDSRNPDAQPRRYRAGENIEDYCRACQVDRMHAIMVSDANGQPMRVICGFCRSEHNYRGGPRTGGGGKARVSAPTTRLGHRDGRQVASERDATPSTWREPSPDPLTRTQPQTFPPAFRPSTGDPWPLVTARERVAPPVDLAALEPKSEAISSSPSPSGYPLDSRDSRDLLDSSDSLDSSDLSDATDLSDSSDLHAETAGPVADLSPDTSMDLELLLRRIIREETGLTPVAPAEKWRGGDLVLRPGRPGVAEKSWPIDTFFHKVVMIRNRLRTLEQQLNASDLPDDVKVKLQSYVTGCYGSLTSFNVLFADERDNFTGSNND